MFYPDCVAELLALMQTRIVEMLCAKEQDPHRDRALDAHLRDLKTQPWPVLIVALTRWFYRFSEYKIYSSFMAAKHPDMFKYHSFDLYGACGVRVRDGSMSQMHLAMWAEENIVENDCDENKSGNESPIGLCLSYTDLNTFVFSQWINAHRGKCCLPGFTKDYFPSYLQLDHVYGLAASITPRLFCTSGSSG